MWTVSSQVTDYMKLNLIGLPDGDPFSEPPLKESLKTSEVSEETIKSSQSLEELDINPELLPHQKKAIGDIFIRKQGTFGLDNISGHLATKANIPLKEGARKCLCHLLELPLVATKSWINK